MAEKIEKSHEQIYQERIQWAIRKAEELGIEYDRENDPDHFKIGNNILPTWSQIPLQDGNQNPQKPVAIEEAVEAIKQFPSENLFSAIQKLRAGKSSK